MRVAEATGLVGRDAELGTHDAALDDATSAPTAVLVEGPAGIGKSSL